MAYKRISPTPVIEGGSGVTTMTTAYAPVCAGTTATGALQVADSGLSTAGNILTSNGSSSLPTWQGSSIALIIDDSGFTSGTTITLTGGTSGAVFTGSGSTMTESFNYLSLATSSSANGQIKLNGTQYFHGYGTDNIYFGKSAGNFTQTGNGQNVGVGSTALALTSTGIANVAVGYLSSSAGIVTSNTANVALGANSLAAVTSGFTSVALGASALSSMLTTQQFTAVGASALSRATSSNSSVGVGYQGSMGVTSGGNACGLGSGALSAGSLTGAANAALGYNAGSSFTTSEASNICINNTGVAGNSNTCRIGAATGTGTQQLNLTFIHGVRGITTVNNNAIAVLIDSLGQMGTTSSSIRYKENIEDMGDVSSSVIDLRPVTFDFIGKPSHKKQVGLIAEEVQNKMPNLVAYNQDNEVESVKYQDISILLLNEIKKALERIKFLESKLV